VECFLLEQVSEGASNDSIMSHKLSVVASEPKETSELCDSSG
jgi:hypothetical protein